MFCRIQTSRDQHQNSGRQRGSVLLKFLRWLCFQDTDQQRSASRRKRTNRLFHWLSSYPGFVFRTQTCRDQHQDAGRHAGSVSLAKFLRWLCFQDTDLQQKIDHEIKMREGTTKLLAASKHPNQRLEAARSLLCSNTRIIAYMTELQRRKTQEVLGQSQYVMKTSCWGPPTTYLPNAHTHAL